MTAYFAMRGYFTFLIVLAACLLIVSLFQFNINSKYSNTGRAIWVERYHQTEMNVKEAIVEAAREGAREGLAAYISCLLSSAITSKKMPVPDINCIKIYVNYFAVEKIASINGAAIDNMAINLDIDPKYYPPPDISLCPPPKCECTSCSSSSPGQNKNLNFLLDGDFNQTITTINDKNKWDALKNGQEDVNDTAKTALSQSILTIQNDAITVRINSGVGNVSFKMPQAEVKIG